MLNFTLLLLISPCLTFTLWQWARAFDKWMATFNVSFTVKTGSCGGFSNSPRSGPSIYSISIYGKLPESVTPDPSIETTLALGCSFTFLSLLTSLRNDTKFLSASLSLYIGVGNNLIAVMISPVRLAL